MTSHGLEEYDAFVVSTLHRPTNRASPTGRSPFARTKLANTQGSRRAERCAFNPSASIPDDETVNAHALIGEVTWTADTY